MDFTKGQVSPLGENNIVEGEANGRGENATLDTSFVEGKVPSERHLAKCFVLVA